MPKSHNEYFSKYVSYFPTIDKQLRLGRNGTINVTDKKTGQVENYKSWIELNNVYQQFPEEIEMTTKTQKEIKVETPVITVSPKNKVYVFGHATRYEEIAKFFKDTYGIVNSFSNNSFNKPGWVYYVDSKNNLVSTGNEIVIDLLKNSADWEEYKLPEPVKFTKAEIAEMIGMNVESFIIVD